MEQRDAFGTEGNGTLGAVVVVMDYEADLGSAARYDKLTTAGRREVDRFTGRESNRNALRFLHPSCVICVNIVVII